MTTVTDSDLKKVEDKIDKLSDKIDKLSDTINQLAIGQVELKEKLNSVNQRLDSQDKSIQKIPDLAEKVGELKGWRAFALVIFSGFITSLFWVFRTGKF
jgi:FtsZ-binding cell division protein ZapB